MSKVPEKPLTVSLKKVTKRGRGRPKKVTLLPDNPVVAQIEKEREDFLKKDRLLKKLRKDPNSLDVLDQMVTDLAFEAALLSFERSEQARHGKDTSVTSGKKITALGKMADLFLKKRSAVLDQAFDFKSKRFEKLLQWLLINIVRDSAIDSGMSEELVNILFDNIGKKFDDDRWMDEAKAFIKS
jgi:hypothetical protein